MTRNLNTVIDTSQTVTVSLENNTYIINATGPSDYNYNLPTINCDGARYIFVRMDNIVGRIVNLNAASGNTLSPIAGTLVPSIQIFTQKYIEVISSGSTWIVLDRKTQATGGGVRFSASFVGNSSVPKITFPNNTNFIYFPFLGTNNGDDISEFIITYESSKSSTYTISLRDSVATTIASTSGTTVLNTITPIIHTLTPAEKALLPTTPTYFYFNLAAVNTDFGIFSVLLY